MNKKIFLFIIFFYVGSSYSSVFEKEKLSLLSGSVIGGLFGAGVSSLVKKLKKSKNVSTPLMIAAVGAGATVGGILGFIYYRHYTLEGNVDALGEFLKGRKFSLAKKIATQIVQSHEDLLKEVLEYYKENSSIHFDEFLSSHTFKHVSIVGPGTNLFNDIEKKYRLFPLLSTYEHLITTVTFLKKRISRINNLMMGCRNNELVKRATALVKEANKIVPLLRDAAYIVRQDPCFANEKETYRRVVCVPNFNHFNSARYDSGHLCVHYTTVEVIYV